MAGRSRPQFLLPDLEAARLYLKEPVLKARLCEITTAATVHLRAAGMDARALFGGGGDWRKFHEVSAEPCDDQ